MPGILITVIGRDKPGLLAKISSTIAELNGNIEDIKGHIVEIEKGKRVASLTLYVKGPKDPVFYDRIKNEMEKIAKEMEIKIYIDPIASF
ncbi:MAG: ACT domain-containing protein [Candidatus Njordarchaeia archaeon]